MIHIILACLLLLISLRSIREGRIVLAFAAAFLAGSWLVLAFHEVTR